MSVLLAAVLTWAAVGCDLGPEPAPGGQRVEVAEVGILATVPDGWDVTSISDDPDLGFIQVGLDRFVPGAEMRPVLVAHQPELSDQTRPFGCSLAWYGPLSQTPDEALALLYGDASDASSFVTLESLDRPISRARFEDPLAPGTHHEQYALDAGDAILFLWCAGTESCRDDWYSIARSIELMPATN